MDLHLLTNYFNYEPIFDYNPQFLVNKIKKTASKYLSHEQITGIQKAYEFARDAHQNGLPRLSGEPYIIHPIRATEFLMKIRPELASIQACLLHDVIEDTNITYEDIKKEFGIEVADLCEGLVKVSSVRYNFKERQLETLKKTFLAMGKDLRVIFIKLADRIHNIQTLHYHPKLDKRRKIAQETLKIYVHIAQRLGLVVFQIFLENGSFKILDEKNFNKIFNFINKIFYEKEQYKEKGIEILSKILDDEDNSVKYYKITGRLKSPYRIYKKTIKYQTKDLGEIMDILAFRIITNNIGNCYNILGIVHGYFTPIVQKIKDYISLPKPNGYRSLHTTILGMFNFPVEIQIRTKEMDQVAEYGIAAHFVYKETSQPISIPKKQSQWIYKMQEIVKNFQEQNDKEVFKNELQIELLDKNIFVYTPKGEVIELPQGSTVLDFAFRIHTDIGLKFKNASVNKHIVPIDYELKNGEYVEIKFYKNKYSALQSRITKLHTPSAKTKLIKFIKLFEKKEIILLAQNIVNQKLQKFNLPTLGNKSDLITKKYKKEELEELLLKIYEKQISLNKFINAIYKNILVEKKYITLEDNTEEYIDNGNDKNNLLKKEKNVIVDTDKSLDYHICPECKPNTEEKIISKVGKNGIKVHNLNCKALENVKYDKLLEAHWQGENTNIYIFQLELQIMDKPGVLLQILTILNSFNISIAEMVTKKKQENSAVLLLKLEFSNPSKIFFVLKELKNNENLQKIINKKIN